VLDHCTTECNVVAKLIVFELRLVVYLYHVCTLVSCNIFCHHSYPCHFCLPVFHFTYPTWVEVFISCQLSQHLHFYVTCMLNLFSRLPFATFILNIRFLAVLSRFIKADKSSWMSDSSAANWWEVIVVNEIVLQYRCFLWFITLDVVCACLIFIWGWFLLNFDDRFARAYHLRGLLFHAMGEHRYLCNRNCWLVGDWIFFWHNCFLLRAFYCIDNWVHEYN
jgi:hypothetical protein